jgi:hypothetical protein
MGDHVGRRHANLQHVQLRPDVDGLLHGFVDWAGLIGRAEVFSISLGVVEADAFQGFREGRGILEPAPQIAGHDRVGFIGMSLDIAHRRIPGAGERPEVVLAVVENIGLDEQAVDDQPRLLRGIGQEMAMFGIRDLNWQTHESAMRLLGQLGCQNQRLSVEAFGRLLDGGVAAYRPTVHEDGVPEVDDVIVGRLLDEQQRALQRVAPAPKIAPQNTE